MHRQWLLNKLSTYEAVNEKEARDKIKLSNFVGNNTECFASEHPPKRQLEKTEESGHITGSAWILNKDKSKVLLTHHKKLKRWLQLGGHSDGHPNVLETAHREACEESGIDSIISLADDIFDIDVHAVPAKTDRPAHIHYDIRFLFQSPITEDFFISHESLNLKWIPLNEVKNYNSSESIMRMCRKSEML